MMVQHDRIEPKFETQSGMNFYTVDCNSQCDCEKPEIHHIKSAPVVSRTFSFDRPSSRIL